MTTRNAQATRVAVTGRSLAAAAGRLLNARGLTLAVAESCTGGLIGHRITSVSGSSRYFLGGIVAYSNDVKMRLARVDPVALQRHGAVSAVVARQLAEGARRKLGADIGIGVTGVAGPGGGTPAKPVGLVFIGVSTQRGCDVRRFRFAGTRAGIKSATCGAALEMLIEHVKR